MRHQHIQVGMTVRVREPGRWCEPDGSPCARTVYKVVGKRVPKGYREPWIVVDGGGCFRAKDLEPVVTTMVVHPTFQASIYGVPATHSPLVGCALCESQASRPGDKSTQ